MANPFDRLLVSCPNAGGLFYLDGGTAWKLDGLDTTGLTVRDQVIARAMQPAGLVLFSRSACEVDGQLARIDDLHDAYVDDGSCFVVSTHGNEIVQFGLDGVQRNRWAFPGEPDAWHINCVARWNGRMVFSAFADRRTHRAYKLPPLDEGFVQDLESGERPIAGLFQPHSLVADGDHLLLANSGAFELHEYDANGRLLRKIKLDGYTRGVLRVGAVVYVGLSQTRNVDVRDLTGAVLVALDADSWCELGRVALPTAEIYAVQALSEQDAATVVARIAAHASTHIGAQMASAAAARDVCAQRAEAADRALGDLQRESERKIFGLLETVHGKDAQIQNRDQIIRDQEAASTHAHAQFAAELLAARQGGEAQSKRIDALVDELLTSSQALRAQLAELNRAKDTIVAQSREIANRDQAITTIQHTLSWRITKPLRMTRRTASWALHLRWLAPVLRPVNKARHVCRTLSVTLGDPERRARYTTLARVLGPRLAVKHTIAFLRRGGPRPRPPVPVPVFDIRANCNRRAVILTTPHCDFVAASIQHALARVGVQADVIYERPAAGYADLPHFVVCPQMFESLPALYVAFQMEQSVSTRWFTPAYIDQLEHSFAILDYSLANIDALVEKGLQRKQFFYMPLGYVPDYRSAEGQIAQDYDVAFYGDINNDRRRAFVDALGKVCRVKVLCNVFGDALHAELARAKLVVNIHYYEGALLETTRLWECISLGKLVVSERAANMSESQDLERLVDFVDVNDVDAMVSRVRHWLQHDSERTARIAANDKLVRELPNRFEYFFYRFLLAYDNLTFFRFWQLAGSKLRLAGDQLCLNLPEYTYRRHSFDADNHYGFQAFPGLRHREGWIGCGLSYKLMIMLARQQKMKRLTICEDDVEFRPGFERDFAAVLDKLGQDLNGWDVFSGLLGDLHVDAVIKRVSNVNGHKFAETNRLISMVFNVYNRRVFDRVFLWDECDRNVYGNTIDRYLERTRLRALACHPFLVGHKSELHSTLWGVGNDTMVEMIQRSERLLGSKIDDFIAREAA